MKRALLALLLWGCGRPVITDVPKPDVIKMQQPLAGCEGKAVVALDGRTLIRISPAGTSPLFTFGEDIPAEQVAVLSWNVAGGFIGAVAFIEVGGPNAWTYEYVLLRSDGTVLMRRRTVETFSPTYYLGTDGTLAVAATTGWVARADGSVTELGELKPMTRVLPSGALIVARGNPWERSSQKGVWQDGAFTPLQVPVGEYPEFHVVGSHVVVIYAAELVSVLDGNRISLPAPLAFVEAAAGRYVLLSGVPAMVRVDLETGSVQGVANAPPLSERYSEWNAGMQADGAVLTSEIRGDALQLQRSGDLGQTWSDVGEPMPMGEDFGLGRWMFALESSGSLLVHSMSTGYGHYVNEVQLVSAWGARRLSTGGLYVNGDLNPGATDLSTDGQCAAVWVQSGQRDEPMQLVFLDVEGKQQVVRTAQPGWLRFLR